MLTAYKSPSIGLIGRTLLPREVPGAIWTGQRGSGGGRIMRVANVIRHDLEAAIRAAWALGYV